MERIMADDTVFIKNPGKGAAILPGIGVLKPGWSEVSRKAYAEAPVNWKELPYQVRDLVKKPGVQEITVEEAVEMALGTNDLKTLNKMREGEKRKSVLAAIEHQANVLKLETLDVPALEALLAGEKREHVRAVIEKAITVAGKV
jgi:hypothetical protein